jgi:hypothetical protein
MIEAHNLGNPADKKDRLPHQYNIDGAVLASILTIDSK